MTWAAVSLADKVDTVYGLFGAGEKPTGSRDPLGIRRQAQGLLRILIDLPELTGLEARVAIGPLRCKAAGQYPEELTDGWPASARRRSCSTGCATSWKRAASTSATCAPSPTSRWT